ncbi:MAG: selenocysteine-specific translation elongation factor [Anaerolineales bacterium]
MTTFVVGTAGHVDHGKSALVKAMTGMDPDRLEEEKRRQLTIDLGFAWMQLPGDLEVGIVDVPGHRDFIENMLAGVGGIDAVILVVAADEGVMPQSREHMEILDLLDIPRGMVALTKIDTVQEEGWLDLVEEELRGFLRGTPLADAPIFRVANPSGQGIEDLKAGLASLLREATPREDKKRPRVPIDRVFSLSGFGTVVTGTLLDGRLEIGDQVRILPGGVEARIRGLQSYNEDVDIAEPGTRVAVNISGVEVDEIARGKVLLTEAADRPTRLVDAQVRVLDSSPISIEHDQEVKVFVGSAQRVGRLRVLGGGGTIPPGGHGWIQIAVAEPVVARSGDRFILRRPSPPLTFAGGQIVDPLPGKRHKLRDEQVVRMLERRMYGGLEEALVSTLQARGPSTGRELAQRLNRPLGDVESSLDDLRTEGRVAQLATSTGTGSLHLTTSQFNELKSRAKAVLSKHHDTNPLRAGMPLEELRSRLSFDQDYFPALLARLVKSGELTSAVARVKLDGFEPQPSEQEAAKVDALLSAFGEAPYSPPSVKESVSMVGEELYNFLLAEGALIQVSPDVVFRRDAYQGMVKSVRNALSENDKITVAEARDRFDTSRKYIMALLEHMDEKGITVREGDYRRLA